MRESGREMTSGEREREREIDEGREQKEWTERERGLPDQFHSCQHSSWPT